mgnify:CR=1 FL=1
MFQCFEGDSDAEKLSPLLVTKKVEVPSEENNLEKEIHNNFPEPDKKPSFTGGLERGDDSDYYTPEDPAPTVTSPLYESDKVDENNFFLDSTKLKNCRLQVIISFFF